MMFGFLRMSRTRRQQAGSSADLIGSGRKVEHGDTFANQCHHETHTHVYAHRVGVTYSNPVRVEE